MSDEVLVLAIPGAELVYRALCVTQVFLATHVHALPMSLLCLIEPSSYVRHNAETAWAGPFVAGR